MKSPPREVIVTEVGPRDGLQNERALVPVEAKVDLVESLVEAGLRHIEVTSFVSPKWVPQLADAAEVYRRVRKREGVRYIVLTPNRKGMERALEVGANGVAVFTAASESFTKKNINSSIEQSILNFREVLALARSQNIWVRAYVSTCFVCPYEGGVAPEAVRRVALRLLEEGIDELSLGDTIGAATPRQVDDVLDLLLKDCDPEKIALHFHDTRGTALVNVFAGLQKGIRKFDSSAGGLGGCPYAPGASGNLATEDLVYFLRGMDIASGIDLDQVASASGRIATVLGRSLPSRYLQAHLAQAERLCASQA